MRPMIAGAPIRKASGKKIADHDPWVTPATIEDPKALDEIRQALEAR